MLKLLLHRNLKTRQVPKLRSATPPNSEVRSTHLLHFKQIFEPPPLKKVVKKAPVRGVGCVSKTCSFSNACENLGALHLLGAKICFFRKMRFRWVQFNIEILKVIRPNFTGLASFNAVQRVTYRF